MDKEETLVLLKPDAVMKGVVEEIKGRYRDAGLQIIRECRLRMDESMAQKLYQDHAGRFYFEGLVLSMTSGPCVALVIEGENAISTVRRMNGDKDPRAADEGTIRKDFQSAGGPFNTVHEADSLEAAMREIKVVFRERTKR